ncbi:rhamnogalacturonan acetylesterase [Paenibacillus crassostreae]|uniref:GDSL family lipase n=1 Tax=Paenibacillus crassostreae TaxID=1763538 RepID=A0A167CTS8_9BACL|nr:GDSL-type esterase/lipase family protein [Paenibacillus crassostreae]AOZ93548.1 GDSL family lipase [Paenibacillus crassostreae]OAB73568.1 GDSL family lipase [Paenibacillus crassostreae]
MKGINQEWAFDFGIGTPTEGYIGVSADTLYDDDRGYGFQGNGQVFARNRMDRDVKVMGEEQLQQSFCIPKGMDFIIKIPDGTYRITAEIGDAIADTHTIIRAGENKAVLPPISTFQGEFKKVMFTVAARNGNLVLKFTGLAPRINNLHISPVETLTLFIAGDSTVTDQAAIGYPYAGWGQILPALFKYDVLVDNHAISGRSSRSFIEEGRLDEISEKMKSGDFLFVQFGHNDEKSDPKRGTKPYTTYKQHLKEYIVAAKEKQACPVFITPVHRRYFNDDGTLSDTHGDYIIAMKELAVEENIPLIDLAAESKILFEEAGIEGSKRYFMWTYPGEYINHPGGVEDNTHFQELGALRLAERVAEQIRQLDLQPLRMYLR